MVRDDVKELPEYHSDHAQSSATPKCGVPKMRQIVSWNPALRVSDLFQNVLLWLEMIFRSYLSTTVTTPNPQPRPNVGFPKMRQIVSWEPALRVSDWFQNVLLWLKYDV